MPDIKGTAGNDLLKGTDNSDNIYGGDGHDKIYAGRGVDVLYGGNGNDSLYSGTEFTILNGGAGKDTFIIGSMFGCVVRIEDFQQGFDKIDVSAFGITSLDQILLGARFGSEYYPSTLFSTGIGSVSVEGLNNLKVTDFIFDTTAGGPRNLEGTNASSSVFGGTSNDILRGHGHRLLGGNGDDILIADGGGNFLAGGVGKDKFILAAAEELESGNEDTIADFQQGSDKIDISALGISDFGQVIALADNFVGGFTSGVAIEIWSGTLHKIVIENIYRGDLKSSDFIYSTGGARDLYGKSAGDTLFGGSHADKLHSSGGGKLFGGGGNDTLFSSSGSVYLYGQSGNDFFVLGDRTYASRTTIYDFVVGTEKIDISAWGITNFGQLKAAFEMQGPSTYFNASYNSLEYSFTLRNIQKDVLTASNFIFSTGGNVRTVGTDAADKLFAGTKGDTLDGKGGDDGLYGGDGADTLIGGDGRNTFYGGDGKDTFVIGGRKTALYETKNVILDFTKGSDKIDVSALGVSNFDQLKYIMQAVGGGVFINAHLGYVEHSITIKGFDLKKLTAGDFVFNTGRPIETTGGDGPDVIFGSKYGETLHGNGDILFGGSGDDILIGSDCEMYGQDGADIFRTFGKKNFQNDYSFHNTVKGFEQGKDKIDLSALGISSFDQLQYILAEWGTGGTRIDAFYNASVFNNGYGYDFAIENISIDKIKSSDFIYFNGGAQTITGSDGSDRLFGSLSGDVLKGGRGYDELYGGDGDDTLYGGDHSDGLAGGKGNDTLIGGAMADVLFGESGSDTASYRDATAGVVASLANSLENTGDAAGDIYSSIENLTGSRYADKLIGSDESDNILTGGGGADALFGGLGRDTASYSDASKGVIASLANPSGNSNDARGDTYSSIENLTGSIYSDKLTGDKGANNLLGCDGDDLLEGGDGNDTLIGGVGADSLVGGTGTDIASYAGSSQGVMANLGKASANTNDAKGDTYSSIENLAGSSYADILTGNSAKNTLNGGGGDDRLYSGTGSDVLIGGAGKDTFVFNSKLGLTNISTIDDFNVADDTIWLDDDVFTAIGNVGSLAAEAFHGGSKSHDASDRIVYDKTTGKLWYDADGSGKGEAIQFALLDKNLTITVSDFSIIA